VLEKLAAEGKLDLEYHGDDVVFWKKADNKLLVELEKKLKDGDMEARCEAVYDLAQFGDPRIYPLLFATLRDPDENVRIQTLKEIAGGHLATLRYGAGVEAVADSVLAAYTAPQLAGLRKETSEILGACGLSIAARKLCADLQDPDPQIRASAAKGLAYASESEEIVTQLISLLKDPNVKVRTNAAESLVRFHGPRSVSSLLVLLSDADSMVRYHAAIGLGHMQDPTLTSKLLELLGNHDSRVRHGAAIALREIHPSSNIAEPMFELLHDSDPDVRRSAAAVLTELHDLRAIKILTEQLTDVDDEVQGEAAWYLGRLRTTQAFDILVALSKSPVSRAREHAVDGVVCSRDPRAGERLIALSRDEDYGVRQRVGNDFVRGPVPIDAESVQALLHDREGHSFVAEITAWSLIWSRNGGAINTLLTLSYDADSKVRIVALSGLAKTTNPRATQRIIALMKDPVESVRVSAAEFANGLPEPRIRTALAEYQKALEAEQSEHARTDF